MKIWAVFASIILAAAVFDVSAEAQPRNITLENIDTPRTVVMTGEGEVSAQPDEAIISGGAVTDARTASEAVAANGEIMSRVFDALQRLGVSKTAIATSAFTLEPEYPPQSDKNPQPHVIIGYEASNSVNVTLDDVTQAGAVLDALIDAGANKSAGVEFKIKNARPLLNEARTLAGKDALERAEIYSKSVGAELGPVQAIHEGAYAGRESGGEIEEVIVTAERRATPIEAAAQTVSANVTITWALK